MSEFNIEDLDAVIARSREGSLAQMLALQLKVRIKKHELMVAANSALAAENKKAVDAVTVFSNVTHDITEIICDELGHDRVAEIVAAYNDLGNMPATDAYLAGIKADGVEEFASYISLYNSNAEHHALDFAKQLREGADK